MALTLVDLLRNAASAHPGRPAVGTSDGSALTYSELDQRSARIAATLRRFGIGRGDRVGILIPKSLESVVGVWGALRVGAAYVPIDPATPLQRAAFIAANCAMSGVLVSSASQQTITAVQGAVPGIRVVHVDERNGQHAAGAETADDDAARQGRQLFETANVNSRDLAYILYTSGSTGVPKGVMVSHAAALSFVEWAACRFGVRADDVLSNHAPLHFDLSTFDIFGAAWAGAKVVVLDDETVRFPIVSANVLERERITVWYSVPGALRRMVRLGRLAGRDLASLRVVLFAGESYPADELRALQCILPAATLFNLFGPTETNVCTYWQVPPVGRWSHSSIPIGIDCENCQSVVVNSELKPVADGTPGELLVRGGTLMEGYWGDAGRTNAAFVPDFLYPHLADRFYRTGDIVSRRQGGEYVFHGRADHMVKVRGYRVELGEVEDALHHAAGVTEAAVVAVDRDAGEGPHTELVAFVVPVRGDDSETTDRVRRHLSEILPKYMIPVEFCCLPSLPMTSTGKVDRRKLHEAAMSGRPPFDPPRD